LQKPRGTSTTEKIHDEVPQAYNIRPTATSNAPHPSRAFDVIQMRDLQVGRLRVEISLQPDKKKDV
jgi:hypothetical protein